MLLLLATTLIAANPILDSGSNASGSFWDSCQELGAATISCIFPLFSQIVSYLFAFSGIAAVFFVFFAGFKFLASGGDEKKIEEARKALTFAIIGLVVIILSFAILNLIIATVDPALKNCLLRFGTDQCK